MLAAAAKMWYNIIICPKGRRQAPGAPQREKAPIGASGFDRVVSQGLGFNPSLDRVLATTHRTNDLFVIAVSD